MHQKEHTDNIPEGEKLFFASLPLFFFNLPSQTEMISCHESNVLISLLLGQETKVTPLIASRHYLHMMIENKKQKTEYYGIIYQKVKSTKLIPSIWLIKSFTIFSICKNVKTY